MMAKRFTVALAIATGALLASCATAPLSQATAEQSEKPKYVILMVSDGIGFNGWLAADYYQGLAGQQSYQVTRPDGTEPVVLGLAHSALNLIDENGNLIPRGGDSSLASGAVEQGYDPTTRWRSFETTMANDFAVADRKLAYTSYTDSAAAGTALISGRKTWADRLNVDWTGTIEFETFATRAMDRGLSTGAVSSVMASHATPAAVIAHNVSRDNYVEIFNEMVASDLTVIMGGGHPLYDGSGNVNDAPKARDFRYVGGKETLGKLTSDEGLNGFTFIDAKDDFAALADGTDLPDRVIGIARTNSTLQAARMDLGSGDTVSGMAYYAEVPDLATMTRGALNVLSQDEDGFFVMIEGGAVDWMGHANDMPRFIEEQMDFNASVDAVIEWVETNSSWDETLLIITSDHECGGIWGEGTWTNSVGGPVATSRDRAVVEEARYNPATDRFNAFLAVQDRGKGHLPGYQFSSPNHTNELVPLWAIGAGSERFAEFTRTDLKAADLWGEQYDWDGQFVDNTRVFDVMSAALED